MSLIWGYVGTTQLSFEYLFNDACKLRSLCCRRERSLWRKKMTFWVLRSFSDVSEVIVSIIRAIENPEYSHLQTRLREKVKFYFLKLCGEGKNGDWFFLECLKFRRNSCEKLETQREDGRRNPRRMCSVMLIILNFSGVIFLRVIRTSLKSESTHPHLVHRSKSTRDTFAISELVNLDFDGVIFFFLGGGVRRGKSVWATTLRTVDWYFVGEMTL